MQDGRLDVGELGELLVPRQSGHAEYAEEERQYLTEGVPSEGLDLESFMELGDKFYGSFGPMLQGEEGASAPDGFAFEQMGFDASEEDEEDDDVAEED
jgi:hypothetical protein